jgi:hypothetical protein
MSQRPGAKWSSVASGFDGPDVALFGFGAAGLGALLTPLHSRAGGAERAPKTKEATVPQTAGHRAANNHILKDRRHH